MKFIRIDSTAAATSSVPRFSVRLPHWQSLESSPYPSSFKFIGLVAYWKWNFGRRKFFLWQRKLQLSCWGEQASRPRAEWRSCNPTRELRLFKNHVAPSQVVGPLPRATRLFMCFVSTSLFHYLNWLQFRGQVSGASSRSCAWKITRSVGRRLGYYLAGIIKP